MLFKDEATMPAPLLQNSISVEEAIVRSQDNLPFIDLKKVDIALLAAIYTYQEHALEPDIDADGLANLYWRTCDITGYEFDPKGVHAIIRRFRNQHLLSCIEGMEITGNAEVRYNLTDIAKEIAKCAIGTEHITALSLDIILETITAMVIAIGELSRKGLTPEEWRHSVTVPFNDIIKELFAVIDKRQASLEREQENVRERISRRLSESWFEAMDECLMTMEEITNILKEIEKVYRRYSYHVTGALEEIATAADAAEEGDAYRLSRKISGYLDTIVSWIDTRLAGWVRYHNQVSYYINDLVRTDPHRKRSQKITEIAKMMVDKPFVYRCIPPSKVVLFREESARSGQAIVTRSTIRNLGEEETEKEYLHRVVKAAVRNCVHDGQVNLVEVGKKLDEDLPEKLLWRAFGFIPYYLMQEGVVAEHHRKGWHRVGIFEVENVVAQTRRDRE
jgi:chromosome condensin MukBEF complex kleisin-like MukF subunit